MVRTGLSGRAIRNYRAGPPHTKTLGLMRTALLIIGLLIGSAATSILLTGGTCSIFPTGMFCGHNAGILLILYFVLSVISIPFVWAWFKRPAPSVPRAPTCAKCGHEVTFDAPACAHCGYQFGKASR